MVSRSEADLTRRAQVELEGASELRVFAIPQPHLHRSVLSYVARIGSRYERAETSGLSHFLEHMLHRGTRRHPTAHEQAVALESIGGTIDATTGVDRGTLTITCPPESFEAAADILGEVTTAPVFSDIDVERGIVREELLEDLDDRGRLVDPDAILRAQLFGDHPLGFPIVGTRRTLASFDREALRRHHARHYNSACAALGLAGDLPARGALRRALGRAFQGHRRGRPIRAARFTLRPTGPLLRVVRSTTSQVGVRLAAIGPGRSHPQEPAVELLLRIVDDGTSTRLYERLCDRLGLCYEVSAGWEPYDEVGLFDVAAETQDEAVPRVLEEVLTMLRDLAEAGPTREELAKAIRRSRWFADRASDQPEATAEEIAISALAGVPRTPRDRHARLARLTRDDVRKAAERLFDPRRLAVALVGPVSRATERRAKALLGLG